MWIFLVCLMFFFSTFFSGFFQTYDLSNKNTWQSLWVSKKKSASTEITIVEKQQTEHLQRDQYTWNFFFFITALTQKLIITRAAASAFYVVLGVFLPQKQRHLLIKNAQKWTHYLGFRLIAVYLLFLCTHHLTNVKFEKVDTMMI